MITETDKLECEIISCIEETYEMYPHPSIKKEDVMNYLEKCFAAKRIIDEQNKLKQINP